MVNWFWQGCQDNSMREDKCFQQMVLRQLLSTYKRINVGTSLVAQWLRIRRSMRGTQVRSLVQEDPTCWGATKPVHHNYRACALEPASLNYWAHIPQLLKPAHPRAHVPQLLNPHAATTEAHVHSRTRMPQLLKPMRLEPMLRNTRSHRNEKPVHRNKE